jgi:ketosteroid isomerase-like protein
VESSPRAQRTPGLSRPRRGLRIPRSFDDAAHDALVEPLLGIGLDDDRVISLIRVTSSDEIFGGEVDGEWAWLISMRGGRCFKVRTFTDPEQAFEAAGLRDG